MVVLMVDAKDEGGEPERRDYTALFLAWCTCAGPQPSRTSPRADEHSPQCPYRREVEGDAR
jgi:hypothetical protein